MLVWQYDGKGNTPLRFFRLFFFNLHVFVLLLRGCHTILRDSEKACLYDVRLATALF